jgi:hypothetical protein
MSAIMPEIHPLKSGAVTTTTSTAATLIAAPSVGRLCVTSMQLSRTDQSASAITVTMNDTASSVFVLPGVAPANSAAGSTLPLVFDSPLVWAPLTAATIKPSAAVSSLYVTAQGFTVE